MNDNSEAIFRVRWYDNQGSPHKAIVEHYWQIKNLEELYNVISVEVAVPVWAKLDTYS